MTKDTEAMDLKGAMEGPLAVIDAHLDKLQVQPDLRTLRAAILFVEHFVQDVRGGTKVGYYEQAWFREIFRITQEWYIRRYGDAARPQREVALGFIVFLGTPLLLEVPLTLTTPESSGRTVWLHFPNRVDGNEDVLQWIVARPGTADLSRRRRAKLIGDATLVGEKLRSIRTRLAVLEGQHGLIALAQTIEGHLRKAAGDACSKVRADSNVALWELHLAVEKALKCYIWQQAGELPKECQIHKLPDLLKATRNSALQRSLAGPVAMFASDKDAIGHRYAGLPRPTPKSLFRTYKCALRSIAHVAEALRVSLTLNDAKLLLARPPWLAD